MEEGNDERPVLVCLHFLGGSALSWQPVTALLGGRFRCLALDLPGFGDATAASGYTVDEMAGSVVRAIRAEAPARWCLAGHSMGAKVASLVARRAEAGEPGLIGLEGLALLAGSPPGQEPMDDDKRRTMLGWFQGDPRSSLEQAQSYIEDNSAELHPGLKARAVSDVLRADAKAWQHWLEHGSREDLSETIGRLRTPAVVAAGEADAALGPEAQRRLMMPHFENARLVSLPETKHLLPLERPHEVADLLSSLVS